MVCLGAAIITYIQIERMLLDWRWYRTCLLPGRSSSQHDCSYQVCWWPDFPPSGCNGRYPPPGSQCPSHSASTYKQGEEDGKKDMHAVIPHGADKLKNKNTYIFKSNTIYWQFIYSYQICSRCVVVSSDILGWGFCTNIFFLSLCLFWLPTLEVLLMWCQLNSKWAREVKSPSPNGLSKWLLRQERMEWM